MNHPRTGGWWARFTRWLGPRGMLIWGAAMIWLVIGAGTIAGYSGKPTDAPHLIIPASMRGTVWIATAVAAIALARGVHTYRVALALLSLMPAVRLTSYLAAWVFSWPWLHSALPDGDAFTGAPSGWYGATSWATQIVLLAGVKYAPVTWSTVWSYMAAERKAGQR